MNLNAKGLGRSLGPGDVLYQVRRELGLLLDALSYPGCIGAGSCEGPYLLHGSVIHHEVLIEVLSVAPDVSFQELYALCISRKPWIASDMVFM